MKIIIGFIQPFKARNVVEALHGIRGLTGATFTDVRGFGRGRAKGASGVTDEELLGTVPKVRVEAMVPDDLVDVVVRAIRESARTGNRGDGKVYVIPMEKAARVGTAEEGEAAV